MSTRILIVDDDTSFRHDLAVVLEDHFEIETAGNGQEAIAQLRAQSPDAVLLDLMLGPTESGLELLKQIQKADEYLPVIMITEHASVDSAVEAMRLGAFTYVSKTTRTDELVLILQKAINQRKLRQEASTLREEVGQRYYEIVGDSAPMAALREKIKLFADNPGTVLITGESGTGKELVARQIHLHSKQQKKPFVPINCAAIPKDLFESEIFGHEAGAFTGANKRKPGRLEIAADGAVFLDEIGELDLNAQSKLLRVLEEHEYERVGGVKPLKTDARVITATNRDLEKMLEEGTFREDLFYRLEMLTIHVPAVRQRRADIPQLIGHFLEVARLEMKTERKHFSDAAIEHCMEYNWPGNVRELRNAVNSAAIIAPGDTIEVDHLKGRIVDRSVGHSIGKIPKTWEEMNEMRARAEEVAAREVERAFLEHLLDEFDGNVSEAARHININRSNLYRMMKRCGLA